MFCITRPKIDRVHAPKIEVQNRPKETKQTKIRPLTEEHKRSKFTVQIVHNFLTLMYVVNSLKSANLMNKNLIDCLYDRSFGI